MSSDAPDTQRSAARSAPSTDAFDMLVQLTQETRDDVKHIRTQDLPEIRDRLTRLEAQSPTSASWSMPAKAGAGITGVVALVYALLQLAQSTGLLPGPLPAPSAPLPPPPAALAP